MQRSQSLPDRVSTVAIGYAEGLMAGTMPMRIDGELFEAAKSVGALASRGAAQQISHGVRIGRELEASPGTSQRDIQRVLAGRPLRRSR
ncbi:TA system antitoxin ParD family protein [Humibacter antri]